MTVHIECAAAQQITFDSSEPEMLTLDYGDSDGLLVITGSKSDFIDMYSRMRAATLLMKST